MEWAIHDTLSNCHAIFEAVSVSFWCNRIESKPLRKQSYRQIQYPLLARFPRSPCQFVSQEIPDSISRALLLSLSTFEYKSCLYCLIHFTFFKGTNFCLFLELKTKCIFSLVYGYFFLSMFSPVYGTPTRIKKKKGWIRSHIEPDGNLSDGIFT